MRLLCQRIAQKANHEDETSGKFWQNRYRAVRLIDDEAILAYVDLNPIRAGVAQTIKDSQFTSARLRLQTIVGAVEGTAVLDDALNDSMLQSTKLPETNSLPAVVYSAESTDRELPIPSSVVESSASTQASVELRTAFDSFLAPIEIDKLNDPIGARASADKHRCSDKGFLAMPTAAYLELLDWTARQIVTGKRGASPKDTPPIFERLKIKPAVWYELVTRFCKLFSLVAGQPHRVDEYRGRLRKKRYHLRQAARELLSAEPISIFKSLDSVLNDSPMYTDRPMKAIFMVIVHEPARCLRKSPSDQSTDQSNGSNSVSKHLNREALFLFLRIHVSKATTRTFTKRRACGSTARFAHPINFVR